MYLLACADLELDPAHAVAVEDSASGIRAAHAAGMRVVAVPDPRAHVPPPDVLALAHHVIRDLRELAALLT